MDKDKKGGFSLVIGSLGGKKPSADEGADERLSAARALRAAVKGGDDQDVVDAFQLMYDACSEAPASPAEPSETADEELDD